MIHVLIVSWCYWVLPNGGVLCYVLKWCFCYGGEASIQQLSFVEVKLMSSNFILWCPKLIAIYKIHNTKKKIHNEVIYI